MRLMQLSGIMSDLLRALAWSNVRNREAWQAVQPYLSSRRLREKRTLCRSASCRQHGEIIRLLCSRTVFIFRSRRNALIVSITFSVLRLRITVSVGSSLRGCTRLLLSLRDLYRQKGRLWPFMSVTNTRGLACPAATVQHNSDNAENVMITYNQSLMHAICDATQDGCIVHVLVQQHVYCGCMFCGSTLSQQHCHFMSTRRESQRCLHDVHFTFQN